jgi:hypothetical protein
LDPLFSDSPSLAKLKAGNTGNLRGEERKKDPVVCNQGCANMHNAYLRKKYSSCIREKGGPARMVVGEDISIEEITRFEGKLLVEIFNMKSPWYFELFNLGLVRNGLLCWVTFPKFMSDKGLGFF